jgi:hypothetical protein
MQPDRKSLAGDAGGGPGRARGCTKRAKSVTRAWRPDHGHAPALRRRPYGRHLSSIVPMRHGLMQASRPNSVIAAQRPPYKCAPPLPGRRSHPDPRAAAYATRRRCAIPFLTINLNIAVVMRSVNIALSLLRNYTALPVRRACPGYGPLLLPCGKENACRREPTSTVRHSPTYDTIG